MLAGEEEEVQDAEEFGNMVKNSSDVADGESEKENAEDSDLKFSEDGENGEEDIGDALEEQDVKEEDIIIKLDGDV